MSYPTGLDEHDEADLELELERRRLLRKAGCCDYCGRKSDTPPCKFPARHEALVEEGKPRTK